MSNSLGEEILYLLTNCRKRGLTDDEIKACVTSPTEVSYARLRLYQQGKIAVKLAPSGQPSRRLGPRGRWQMVWTTDTLNGVTYTPPPIPLAVKRTVAGIHGGGAPVTSRQKVLLALGWSPADI